MSDPRFYSGQWYHGTLSTSNYRFDYIREHHPEWGDVDAAEEKAIAAELVECTCGGSASWKWCPYGVSRGPNKWGCKHQELYDTGLKNVCISVCTLPDARDLARNREIDCAIGML